MVANIHQEAIRHKLAVFFPPMVDESTSGWLHRLAHCNAATIADFQSHMVEDKCMYSALIEHKASYLHEPNNIELSFPFDVKPEEKREYINHFTGRYCPHCFAEDETPYFRSAWSAQWLNHCLKHDTPLTDSCINCNSLTKTWICDWNNSWGICCNCSTSYTTQYHHEPHEVFAQIIKPTMLLLRGLFETPNHETEALVVSIRYIKMLLTNCYEEARTCRFEALRDFGINPDSYLCCGRSINRGNQVLLDDAAYALAYKIVKHQDFALITNELETVYQRKIMNKLARRLWY